MKYFYLSALFAVMQVLLLTLVIYLLNRNRYVLAAIGIIFKIIAYIYGVRWLFITNIKHIIPGGAGYIFGLPFCATVMFIVGYRAKKRAARAEYNGKYKR